MRNAQFYALLDINKYGVSLEVLVVVGQRGILDLLPF